MSIGLIEARVCDRARRLRVIHGLSQKDLAMKLGVDRVVVAKWERGLRGMSIDEAVKVAEVFGVALEALISPSALRISMEVI